MIDDEWMKTLIEVLFAFLPWLIQAHIASLVKVGDLQHKVDSSVDRRKGCNIYLPWLDQIRVEVSLHKIFVLMGFLLHAWSSK